MINTVVLKSGKRVSVYGKAVENAKKVVFVDGTIITGKFRNEDIDFIIYAEDVFAG